MSLSTPQPAPHGPTDPSADGGRTVLDSEAISRALTRIAHEILERNRGGESLVLLGGVAVVLINRNRWFLTGQESSPGIRERVLGDLKAMPEIDKVAYLRLEFVGPRQLLLVASIDLTGEQPESHVAYTLRELEHRLEQNPNLVDAVLTLATPDEAAL